jgi:hypothetical protein
MIQCDPRSDSFPSFVARASDFFQQPASGGSAGWGTISSLSSTSRLRNQIGSWGTRFQRLGDNPSLLIRRPSASPSRTRQDLDPPKSPVRVSLNVIHNDGPKPPTWRPPGQALADRRTQGVGGSSHWSAIAATQNATHEKTIHRPLSAASPAEQLGSVTLATIVHARPWALGERASPSRQPFYPRFIRLRATNGRRLSDISGLA